MRPLSDCAIHTYSHDLARPRRTLQETQASSRQVSKKIKKIKQIQKNERKALWTLAVTSQCRIRNWEECVKAKLLACIAWRHAVSERRASVEGPHKAATSLAVSAGTDVPLQGSGKLETEAICWRYAASTRLLSGWPRLAP
jgi:hypothetical protein